MSNQTKIKTLLEQVLVEADNMGLKNLSLPKLSPRVKNAIDFSIKSCQKEGVIDTAKGYNILVKQYGKSDVESLTNLQIHEALMNSPLLKENKQTVMTEGITGEDIKTQVLDAMRSLVKVVNSKQIPEPFSSVLEFVNDWRAELPWTSTEFMSIAHNILFQPQYKRVLDQFKKVFKYDLERELLNTIEEDSTENIPVDNMPPVHLNSTKKEGKVLKEAEGENNSNNAIETLDEIRTNLQNAQSALVIGIPNKYQTLYQAELAKLYDQINNSVNEVLNLAKKMKSELSV